MRFSVEEIADVTGGTAFGHAFVDGPATIDSRAVAPSGLFVALVGEHADGHQFVAQAMDAGAAAVLSSRMVAAPGVVVDDVTAALGLLAREHVRRLGLPVFAVTGSQGKTSVKDLLAHVLAATGPVVAPVGSFNNELGVPLTVLRADQDTAHLVVEMGARGAGHIAELCRMVEPTIGAVLNVGHAHVGEFGSPELTAAAKGELVEALGPDGVAVLNADDPLVSRMASRTSARVLTFGTEGDVALGPVQVDALGQPGFTLSFQGGSADVHLELIGAHHAMNAAAAAAVALAAGMSLTDIADRLSTASAASPMRMQRHIRADGLTVIDDSYNANPESMEAALRAVAAFGGPRSVAVLGEMLELGDGSASAHRRIGELAAELGFSRVVVVGDGARPIADGAGPIAEFVDDVSHAIAALTASLAGDEVVVVKASRGCRLERVVNALIDS